MSAYERAQTRLWQIQDRDLARADHRAEREQDRANTAAAVGLAWSSGDVVGATAGGIPETKFNLRALADLRRGDLSGLTRAFRVSGYVSPAVKQELVARVDGSKEEQYGKNMEAAYHQWQALYAANPGMAQAYYGQQYHEQFRAFDAMVRSGLGPSAAYLNKPPALLAPLLIGVG